MMPYWLFPDNTITFHRNIFGVQGFVSFTVILTKDLIPIRVMLKRYFIIVNFAVINLNVFFGFFYLANIILFNIIEEIMKLQKLTHLN